MMHYIQNTIVLCVLTLVVFTTLPSEGTPIQEYEEVPSHTKTVVITNTSQTDVSFELFTVSKWGKMVSNFTWDGGTKDDLDVRVNFWTIELKEAIQADYGDLGSEILSSYTTFPKVDSHRCELYWVEDEQLPITIYYEIDRTKNPNHEIELGITLNLEVKYYDLKGKEATKDLGGTTEEYEDVPSRTKTVVITNTTQTDVAFELFTVNKWGKMVSNFTWDGGSKDDLDVRVNFWTIELNEAIQADYGDLGSELLSSYSTFPIINSYRCEVYWVDDNELPVTISYEIDKTKNPDHEIEQGTNLTLEVNYYDYKGEKGTEEASATGLVLILLTLVTLVVVDRRRPVVK